MEAFLCTERLRHWAREPWLGGKVFIAVDAWKAVEVYFRIQIILFLISVQWYKSKINIIVPSQDWIFLKIMAHLI